MILYDYDAAIGEAKGTDLSLMFVSRERRQGSFCARRKLTTVYLLNPALHPGLQPPGSTLRVAVGQGEFELGAHFHNPKDALYQSHLCAIPQVHLTLVPAKGAARSSLCSLGVK